MALSFRSPPAVCGCTLAAAIALSALTLGLSSAAVAQSTPVTEGGPPAAAAGPVGGPPGGPPGGPLAFRVEGGGYYQSGTDLKDSPGSFSVSRGYISVGGEYRWDFRNAAGLSFGTGFTDYDFNNATGLSDGDPWSRIEDYRLSVPVRFSLGETTQAIVIPTVRWEAEEDANLDDGRTYGAIAGVAWRLNETLTIGPGIGVFSRLRGGTQVFPILIIDWSITDRLSLSTGRGLGASEGPGLTLDYRIADDWTLGLAGRYENREFRLDDKGVAPGGIGRDRVYPVVATAVWSPNPLVRLSAFAGVEFGGTLSLLDEEGTVLQDSDYDAAPIFGGTFTFRF